MIEDIKPAAAGFGAIALLVLLKFEVRVRLGWDFVFCQGESPFPYVSIYWPMVVIVWSGSAAGTQIAQGGVNPERVAFDY